MGKKCNYYSEDPRIIQYTPECTGEHTGVHPEDIEGDFCQFCGGKILFKNYCEIPRSLTFEYMNSY